MAVSDPVLNQPGSKPSDLFDQIYDAAEQGEESKLRTLLAQWKRFGFERDMLDNSLGRAVEANQAGSVRLLMQHGARTDSDTVTTAIENAVSMDVWQALVDGGWDPNSLDVSGDPVIFNFLTDPADEPKLVWLLSHGASTKTPSRRTGLTAISWAAGYRPIPILRTLLKHSGTTSGDDLNHSNAVHEAASNKTEDRTAALALLVDELGADVNVLSTYGSYGKRPPRYNRPESRPLHQAVRSGRREHVHFLLDRGAKVTEKDAADQDVGTYAKASNCSEGWKAVEEWYAEKGLEVPGKGWKREDEENVARENAER